MMDEIATKSILQRNAKTMELVGNQRRDEEKVMRESADIQDTTWMHKEAQQDLIVDLNLGPNGRDLQTELVKLFLCHLSKF